MSPPPPRRTIHDHILRLWPFILSREREQPGLPFRAIWPFGQPQVTCFP
jgi:hypothetical protein